MHCVLFFHTFELEVAAKLQVLEHVQNVSKDLNGTEIKSQYILSE